MQTTNSSVGSQTGQTSSGGTNTVVTAGTTHQVQFNIANGDKLDLSQVLAGAPVTQDLTNINQFVQVTGHTTTGSSSSSGVTTTLDISGPSGHATVNLQGNGKVSLDDLLKNNSLIPPHSS